MAAGAAAQVTGAQDIQSGTKSVFRVAGSGPASFADLVEKVYQP